MVVDLFEAWRKSRKNCLCWFANKILHFVVYVLVIGCQCQLVELASPFGSRVDAKGNRRCYAMPSGFLSWNVKKSRSESRKLIKSKWWDQKSSIWVLYVTLFSTLHMFCVLSSTWHFHLLGDAGQRQVESWILSINSISVPSLGKVEFRPSRPCSTSPNRFRAMWLPGQPSENCMQSMQLFGDFWWFCWVFHARCNLVGPYLWLWHLLRTNLSSWLFQAVKRFSQSEVSLILRFARKGFHVLTGGAAQHAMKRPAMVWRRILRSGISLNTISNDISSWSCYFRMI